MVVDQDVLNLLVMTLWILAGGAVFGTITLVLTILKVAANSLHGQEEDRAAIVYVYIYSLRSTDSLIL